MRELTTREKIGIAAVAIAAIVALYFTGILTPSSLGLTGGDLDAKKAELNTTKNLIKFDELVSDIEDDIMAEVGLQDNLIPETLFREISDKLTVEQLNQAKTPKEIYEVVPELKNKASQILAYRNEIGTFENLEQLKEIKCSVFEGEPAQAVISRRISELTQKVGINPKYQLSIKPLPGKKRERITLKDRQRLVEKLYRYELKEELNQLKEELESETVTKDTEEASEPESQKAREPESQSQEAVIENSQPEESGDIEKQPETNVFSEQEEQQMAKEEDVRELPEEEKTDRKFPPLPEKIPVEACIQIAEAILSSNYPITKQISSNPRLRKVISNFQVPEQEKHLNIKPMISFYFDQINTTQKELLGWLEGAPTSYSKQAYVVEMLSVKGKLEQLVKFIHSVESSSRFLKIRDFHITVANKQETLLNANIEILATVL